MSNAGKSKEEKTSDAEDSAEEQPAPRKSKKKLIIFAVIGVVVLALAGGGAFLLLGHKKAPADEEGAAAEETHDVEEKETPPVYLKLDTFTTNLAAEENTPAGTGGQYIQVVVELKVEDAPSGEKLKEYMPEIRNNILRLLSSKHSTELATTEGKDQLASEIRGSVNSVVSPSGKKSSKVSGPVIAVLFSSFVIQ